MHIVQRTDVHGLRKFIPVRQKRESDPISPGRVGDFRDADLEDLFLLLVLFRCFITEMHITRIWSWTYFSFIFTIRALAVAL